jgi:threonine dehydratase
MDVSPARIEEAARVVDPVFRDSPQFADVRLSAALGRDVVVKVETANPLGSFKGRGADFFLRGADRARTLVCATAGNFGQAIAYAGRRHGVRSHVFLAADANPAKIERIRAFGADVTLVGAGEHAAKEEAVALAASSDGLEFVEDGALPAIAEGAGTIAVELLPAGPFDAIVVPVGDGALISGIACWVKEHAPATRVIGVCASGAPALERSFRAGRPVATPSVDTIADVLAVRVPVPESVARLVELVDEMVLVDDEDLLAAIALAADTLGLLLEPGGAAGLAALQRGLVPGERVAAVLTGAGPRPELLPRVFRPGSTAPRG